MSNKFLAIVSFGLSIFLIISFIIVIHNPSFAGGYDDCVGRCNDQFSGCVYHGYNAQYCVELYGTCLDICEAIYQE